MRTSGEDPAVKARARQLVVEARQLIQQHPRPERYVGIDLHRGMIEWCQRNLGPVVPRFEFVHHDVYNYHFNPGLEKPRILSWPVEDGTFTLVEAWSVFTHLTEAQATYYLSECSRVLASDELVRTAGSHCCYAYRSFRARARRTSPGRSVRRGHEVPRARPRGSC